MRKNGQVDASFSVRKWSYGGMCGSCLGVAKWMAGEREELSGMEGRPVGGREDIGVGGKGASLCGDWELRTDAVLAIVQPSLLLPTSTAAGTTLAWRVERTRKSPTTGVQHNTKERRKHEKIGIVSGAFGRSAPILLHLTPPSELKQIPPSLPRRGQLVAYSCLSVPRPFASSFCGSSLRYSYCRSVKTSICSEARARKWSLCVRSFRDACIEQ
uniref:Uncharacterized protein n=1 Tax=Knipowitschia caucasica TaxID=637954 RepID=A0AAV2KKA1_KNICA